MPTFTFPSSKGTQTCDALTYSDAATQTSVVPCDLDPKQTFRHKLNENFQWVLCMLTLLTSLTVAGGIVYYTVLIPTGWDEGVIMMLLLANVTPIKILRQRELYVYQEPHLTRVIYACAEWLQEFLIYWTRVKYARHVAPQTYNELKSACGLWCLFGMIIYLLKGEAVFVVLFQVLYVRILHQLRAKTVRFDDWVDYY